MFVYVFVRKTLVSIPTTTVTITTTIIAICSCLNDKKFSEPWRVKIYFEWNRKEMRVRNYKLHARELMNCVRRCLNDKSQVVNGE